MELWGFRGVRYISMSMVSEQNIDDVIKALDVTCRDRTILMIGPERGDFLYSLVRQYRPKFVVECGTAIGYSGLWIAKALRDNGEGRLLTVEISQANAREARENFTRAGVARKGDSDGAFGWQLLASMNWRAAERFSLFLEYRYMRTEFDLGADIQGEVDFQSSQVSGGVAFHF